MVNAAADASLSKQGNMMKAKILGIALAATMFVPAMAATTPPPNIPTVADMPRLNKLLKDTIAKLSQKKAAQPVGQTPTPFGNSSSTINGLPAAPGWHFGTASICGAKGTTGPTDIYSYMFDSANMVSSDGILMMLLASQACGNPPYGHQFMWHVIPGAIAGEFDQIQGLYY